MKNKEQIDKEINEIAGAILEISQMDEAKRQIHHHCTTLYDHIMRVSYYAVHICDYFEKKGAKVDRKCVITAAICHDLGIVGRERRFKSDPQAWLRHASLSADAAECLLPDADKKTIRAIQKHMWPFCTTVPDSIEEWIVILADKNASMYELKHRKQLRKNYENLNYCASETNEV